MAVLKHFAVQDTEDRWHIRQARDKRHASEQFDDLMARHDIGRRAVVAVELGNETGLAWGGPSAGPLPIPT